VARRMQKSDRDAAMYRMSRRAAEGDVASLLR
jgi:hypothetical protein